MIIIIIMIIITIIIIIIIIMKKTKTLYLTRMLTWQLSICRASTTRKNKYKNNYEKKNTRTLQNISVHVHNEKAKSNVRSH